MQRPHELHGHGLLGVVGAVRVFQVHEERPSRVHDQRDDDRRVPVRAAAKTRLDLVAFGVGRGRADLVLRRRREAALALRDQGGLGRAAVLDGRELGVLFFFVLLVGGGRRVGFLRLVCESRRLGLVVVVVVVGCW